MSKRKENGLTPCEQKAIAYYLAHPDEGKRGALLHAYARARSYPKNKQYQCARQLFDRPQVAEAYAAAIGDRQKSALVQRDRIIAEYEKIAFTDLPDIVDYCQGTIRVEDFGKLDDDLRACIESVKIRTKKKIEDGKPVPVSEIEVKLYSKQKALDSLARIEALFHESVVHSGTVETRQADPTQVLASLIEQATDEEKAVFHNMAERISGEPLPSQQVDPVPPNLNAGKNEDS